MLPACRSHDQFNTTIYGLNDRYRDIYNERRVVMMNPKDMAANGFRLGQAREAKRFIVVPFSIPRRSVATYFPEVNVLVPIGLIARGSKTPVSKRVAIRIIPTDEPDVKMA